VLVLSLGETRRRIVEGRRRELFSLQNHKNNTVPAEMEVFNLFRRHIPQQGMARIESGRQHQGMEGEDRLKPRSRGGRQTDRKCSSVRGKAGAFSGGDLPSMTKSLHIPSTSLSSTLLILGNFLQTNL
jgi:hypothetical protein